MPPQSTPPHELTCTYCADTLTMIAFVIALPWIQHNQIICGSFPHTVAQIRGKRKSP